MRSKAGMKFDCIYEETLDFIDIDYTHLNKTVRYEQRPHGKWEFVGDNLFKCTNCGYIANGDYLRDWKAYTYDSEFPTACPKCGADMRPKEGEAE